MRAWAAFALGIAVGLVGLAWLAGGTHADFYVRASAGGRYLLDARVDEGALGRVINIPAAALGEASIAKRSWAVVTSYDFTLRVRPELAGEDASAIRALEVSVRIPGRVSRTNATRVTAGTAVWEGLPADALVLRTRAVHWIRVIVLGLLLTAAVAGYRRS